MKELANFTPLQADIYDELATEARNNEGIILHLHISHDLYYREKKIVIAKVKAVIEDMSREVHD